MVFEDKRKHVRGTRLGYLVERNQNTTTTTTEMQKQSVKEHVYNFSFGLAVFVLLLVTKVLFHKAEALAYFCCALTVWISNRYYAAGYHAGVVLHFINITTVTMYQFYFDSHRLYMSPWFAFLSGTFLSLHLAFENCVIWVLRGNAALYDVGSATLLSTGGGTVDRIPTWKEKFTMAFAEVYHDRGFRDKYASVSHSHMLFWAMCPIYGSGLLRAPWVRIAAIGAMWVCVSVFEHYKCRACKTIAAGDFVVAHAAYKCAALLYLPVEGWATVFAGLLAWDTFFITRYHKCNSLWAFIRRG